VTKGRFPFYLQSFKRSRGEEGRGRRGRKRGKKKWGGKRCGLSSQPPPHSIHQLKVSDWERGGGKRNREEKEGM